MAMTGPLPSTEKWDSVDLIDDYMAKMLGKQCMDVLQEYCEDFN